MNGDRERPTDQPIAENRNAVVLGLWATDEEDSIVVFDDVMERLLGVAAADVLGRNPNVEIIRGLPSALLDGYREARTACSLSASHATCVTAGGDRAEWIVHFVPILQEGVFRGMGCSVAEADTSERVEGPGPRMREERLRLASFGGGVTFWEWYPKNGHIVYDPAWVKTLGYAPGECDFNYAWWQRSIHPEDKQRFERTFADYLENRRERYELEYRIQTKSGRWMWSWTSGMCVEWDPHGEPIRIMGTNRDITERKRAEEERDRILTLSPDLICIAGLDGHFKYVNPAWERLLGYSAEELLAKPFLDFIHPDDHQRNDEGLARLAQGVETVELENRYIGKDGSVHSISWVATPVVDEGVVYCIGRDVTDRRLAEAERELLEAQLRQAQKLESIGTLASGVAHEINNPLMAMINYAELVEGRLPEDHGATAYAKSIVEEGQRIARIVRSLLTFTRQDEANATLTRIDGVVRDALQLVQAALRRSQIELTVELPSDLPPVRCRAQQLQQVFVNLIANAQSALDERYPSYDPEKTMTIRAGLHDQAGRAWLRVAFEDRGIGISEDHRERIFDPFFSSKARNEGTGLGLAVSHGIVRDHEGRLTFESVPGEGTVFHVDLPLS